MNLNSASPTVTAGTKDKYDTKIRYGVLVHVTDKIIFIEYHCVKSVQIRGYFWSVFSGIRTAYRKIRNRNNSVFGDSSRSEVSFKIFTPARNLAKYQRNALVFYGPYVGIKHIAK